MPIGPREDGVLEVGKVMNELERALPIALPDRELRAELRHALDGVERTALKGYELLFRRRIAAMRIALDKADGVKLAVKTNGAK